MPNPMIERLEQERQDKIDFVEQTVAAANTEGRDLVDAEKRNLEAARDRVKELDEQLAPLHEFEALRSAHREGSRQFRPGGAPAGGEAKGLGAQTQARGHEYRTAGEVMADAWRAKTQQDENATRRLESIGRGIVNGKLEVIDSARARDIDQAHVASLTGEQRADAPHITTTEIPGLMPVTIRGPLINDIDASRPFLTSIGVKDLSGIPGKTFSRPVVTEHVQIGTQSAEKAELTDGQFKVDDVDFTKSTEGGWANVSRQSIDWSSPAMWDGLLADFQDIYARHTENKAADAFVAEVQAGTTAVDTATAGATPTLAEFIAGLYDGAVAVYNAVGALPDHAWVSLDRWALVGKAIDIEKATGQGSGGGSSSLTSMQAGGMLDLPRTVVPSFPSGTVILGRKNRAEAYEDRLGFLSAVEPKLLGIELAYGGYFAYKTLVATAFAELTFTDTP